MELIQAFEDKEVRHLLLGGEADLETAFTQVDAHLRKRFVKGARDRLPGLRPEDLADAWQETLKDLLKAVQSGRFDPDRELVPWLWTIYLRRAFDSVRRRESYESMVERVSMHHRASVADILAENAGEERQLLMARVHQAMSTLPLRVLIRAGINCGGTPDDANVVGSEVHNIVSVVPIRNDFLFAISIILVGLL